MFNILIILITLFLLLKHYISNESPIKNKLNKNESFIIKKFTTKFSYITPQYLSKYYGTKIINAHTTINETYDPNIKKLNLKEFFEKYKDEILYIKEDLDFMYKSFLYREIDKIMKHHFTNLFLRYYLIWIGSKGSKTGIHKDSDEQNLLLQIYGKKKVIIFETDNNSLFNPREIKEGDALLSSLDYWKDRIDIPKKEIILEPGDLLFIPNKYWHCAENLSNSIAISCRSESITKFIKVILKV